MGSIYLSIYLYIYFNMAVCERSQEKLPISLPTEDMAEFAVDGVN